MKPRHWTIDFRQSAIVLIVLTLCISTVQGAWTSFTPPEMTLHSGDFNDLAIQGKTVLWGATAGGGVVKYDITGWRTYTELFAEILHDDVNVICVCRDLSGGVWFGTEAGVSVYRNDSTWDHYTTSDGLAHNRVLSIAIDGTGRKWIGTDGGGVSLFDESTWTSFGVTDGMADSIIHAIAVDQSNAIWFGTNSGVSRYEGGVWTSYTTSNGLADNRINAIFIDQDSTKWFATSNGISVFNSSENDWRTINSPDNFGENIFYTIQKDKLGFYWFGSHRGGVKKYDGTSFLTTYVLEDGLISNTVKAIAIDSNNVRWFGTDNGLSRFINEPPLIDPVTSPLAATQDQSFQYTLTATDTDRDAIVFALAENPSGMTIGSSSGTIDWTPLNSHVDSNTVKVTISDQNGGFDSLTFTILVQNVNDAPLISSTPLTTASQDIAYTYQVIAIDPDGDDLTYDLRLSPSGMIIGSLSGAISWTPGNADTGETTVEIGVSDPLGATVLQRYTLRVDNVNDPPQISSTPLTTASQDIAYSYQVVATDPDGDVLTYHLRQAPSAMAIELLTGAISWTPGNADTGETTIEIGVSDPHGATVLQQYTLRVDNVNDPPQISSTPLTTASQDIAYTYQVVAIDPDGDVLTYHLRQAPSAMTIELLNGAIRWTPGNADTGETTIEIGVSDPHGATVLQQYALRIDNVNDPPQISSTPLTTASQDIAYTYQVVAADPDGDDLTYDLRLSPSGMTIGSLSGAISWTPGNADTGETTIEIGVSDPSGATALQRYTLRVGNVNDPPTLTSVSDTADTIRLNLFATLALEVTGADIDGDAISYRWSWNGTKNISNRTGTWSQVLKTAGMHSLKVVLTDGYVRGDSVQWTIIVQAPVALRNALPVKYALLPAYPNPCRSAARIEYAVPAHKSEGAQVSLKIFDLNGQLVMVLEKGIRQPGTYSVVWSRQDRNGKMLPAGNYLYRFFSDGFTQDRIITLQ